MHRTANNKTKQNEIFPPKMKTFRKGGQKKTAFTLLQICHNFTNLNSDISQTTQQEQE